MVLLSTWLFAILIRNTQKKLAKNSNKFPEQLTPPLHTPSVHSYLHLKSWGGGEGGEGGAKQNKLEFRSKRD